MKMPCPKYMARCHFDTPAHMYVHTYIHIIYVYICAHMHMHGDRRERRTTLSARDINKCIRYIHKCILYIRENPSPACLDEAYPRQVSREGSREVPYVTASASVADNKVRCVKDTVNVVLKTACDDTLC